MCLVGYLRFETGDEIVENMTVCGYYDCLDFRITRGIVVDSSSRHVVRNLLFVF